MLRIAGRSISGLAAIRSTQLLYSAASAADSADGVGVGAVVVFVDMSFLSRAVGERQAGTGTAGTRDVVGQEVEHRSRCLHEPAVAIELGDVELRQAVGRHTVQLRAPPRGPDLRPHGSVQD